MQLETTEIIEAVVLFLGTQITRELLYPEFEAILDGFIPVPDFKGVTAKAVYVRINPQLEVTSAVFFLLDFDAKGMANRRWNIPLQHLSDISGKGPDMGAGPIRLACYSQCAIEWHQKNLWDPCMEPSNDSFAALRKAVKNNRLGIHFKSPPKEKFNIVNHPAALGKSQAAIQSQLHEHYSKELRDQLTNELKEQRLRAATLNTKHKEVMLALQKEHQQRVQAYQQKLQDLEAKNAELESRNQLLKENLDVQASKVNGLREYFSHKLKTIELDGSTQLAGLQQNFDMELELKLQAATSELRERLEMREVELFYRHQNESNLKDEIFRIKQEYHSVLNNSGEQLLQRLYKAGIHFVTFHPGVGQLTVPQDELSAYLDNSAAYLAKRCGVGESVYTRWIMHYQNPVCTGADHRGKLCGKSLVRITSPLEFHEGESDRCEHHQALSYKLSAEMNG